MALLAPVVQITIGVMSFPVPNKYANGDYRHQKNHEYPQVHLKLPNADSDLYWIGFLPNPVLVVLKPSQGV